MSEALVVAVPLVACLVLVVLLGVLAVRGTRTGGGAPPPPVAPGDRAGLEHQVRQLLRQRRKIHAVKLVREATGLPLAQAKAAVDRIAAGYRLSLPGEPAIDPDRSVAAQAAQLKRHRNTIAAISLVRQHTGMSLAEAKRYVDDL